jgi:hypothetical protein
MAYRIKVEDVKKIIDTQRADPEIEAMIEVADLLVTELLLGKYSTGLLLKIEIFLTAHFLAVRDPMVSQKSSGQGPSSTYDGQTGLAGLEQTRFGTQVMMIEYLGVLRRAGQSSREASIKTMP